MDWDLVGRILKKVVDMWPVWLLIGVAILGVFGIIDAYINSKYWKAPWERREAKEAKKRAREEEKARKAFWGE